VLETWAKESDEKRNVMKFRVPILTPRVFDAQAAESSNVLVRADLLRTAVNRVIENIQAVERLPGAELIRGSDEQLSFAEVRAELEDLQYARLDPLFTAAGRERGTLSAEFLEQALQNSDVRYRAAQQRAEAYRNALREYSGVPTNTPSAGAALEDGPENPTDVQPLTPQIDRSFIDRIMELSEVNTTFRQEITRQAINASIEAVNRTAVVEQYRLALRALTRSSSTGLSRAEIDAGLNRVAEQAKKATARFNAIYEEFVRVSLRPGPQMYRVERPVEGAAVRSFRGTDYLFAVAVVAIATPILLAMLFLLQHYGRVFVGSIR
jgi:hypothetical protein